MLKKLTHILYGIRLIVTWTLIVLTVLEGYYLIREFGIHTETCNVVLGEAEYRQYSNEYTMFKVTVDGKDMTAKVPAAYTTGISKKLLNLRVIWITALILESFLAGIIIFPERICPF